MIRNNTLTHLRTNTQSINTTEHDNDGLSIFDSFLKNDSKNTQPKILKKSNLNLKNNINNKVKKKVAFQEPKINDYYSSSDSDSDIGTDIDLEGFKETLYNL